MTTPHVLVVDDNPQVLETTQDVLESSGFQVTTASSWAELSPIVFAGQLDLVLLDLMMPGLRGDALAPVLERFTRPETKIAFYSAMPQADLEAAAARTGIPYTIQKGSATGLKLVAVVRAILAE